MHLNVPVLREDQEPSPGMVHLRKPRYKISAPALLALYSKNFPLEYFNLPTMDDIDSITFQDPVVHTNSSNSSNTLSDYESSDESSDSDDE